MTTLLLQICSRALPQEHTKTEPPLALSLSRYVRVSVYRWARIHISTQIDTCFFAENANTFKHIHREACAHLYISKWVCVCVCVYEYAYTCVYTQVLTYTYIHTYSHTHTHTPVYHFVLSRCLPVRLLVTEAVQLSAIDWPS